MYNELISSADLLARDIISFSWCFEEGGEYRITVQTKIEKTPRAA